MANETLLESITNTNLSYELIVGDGVTGSSLRTIEHIIYSKVVVVVCTFGLLGNIFSLLVLCRKSFHMRMGRMEKFAFAGLVALAASGMLFCIVVLPYAVCDPHQVFYTAMSFCLVYRVYNIGLINVLIMASTWLTVITAVGRYLAICHPLRARVLIGLTFARRAIVMVYIFSVVANFAGFFTEIIKSYRAPGGDVLYYPGQGWLGNRPVLETVYKWVYFQVATCFPLALMAFCNVNLIRALARSASTRSRYSADLESRGQPEHHRLTLTLIIVVLLYIVLVAPAAIISFVNDRGAMQVTDHYNVAVAVVNTLQACNFAFNFILYCAVNAYFRRAAYDLLRCVWFVELVHRQRADSMTTCNSTGCQVLHSGRDLDTVNGHSTDHSIGTAALSNWHRLGQLDHVL